jgi:WD40 repeat protein
LGEATAENRLDIQAFLEQRVSESEQGEKLKEILLEKSSGNFLYAAQALKGIENEIYRLDQLEQDLPPGLNGLYEAYFGNAFGAGESSLYRQINPLLELLCCAHEPLTNAEIEAALGLTKIQRAKMIEFVSQFLGHRSRSNGEETITPYHLSISDWLTSSDHYGHKYLISSAEGQKRLAQYCRAAITESTKRLSWYVRRHAVTHFIEDHDWHSAADLLCDIEYLNSRAQLHELAFVRADFFELSKALSGISEKEPKSQDLLLKIRSYQAFVANHMQALQKHSHRTHFFHQHVYLLSHQSGSLGDCENSVFEAGHSILRGITEPKAIRYFRWIASRLHSFDFDQNQLRLPPTLTDLTLQHRHNWSSVNRAGFSLRNLDESMSRIAISQSGFKCAYSSFVADEHHLYTSRFSQRSRFEVHESSALTIFQTEPNTIRNVGPNELGRGSIHDLSISDCGRHLFFISLGDMTPVRFDTETSSRTSLVPSLALRLAMSFAADRAAVLEQDSIKIWSISNQTVIQEIALEFSHPFYTFSLSSDGNRFVTSDDHKLTIWDVNRGIVIHEIFGNRGWFCHASLSSKGELLASAGVDGVLRIWHSPMGELIAELHGHEGAIRSVYMSGDGTLIYSWGMDSTIRVWRVEDQKCLLLLYLPGVCRFSARTEEGLVAVGFANGDVDLYKIQNLDGA